MPTGRNRLPALVSAFLLVPLMLLSCDTGGHNPTAFGVAGKANTVILLTPAIPTIYWDCGKEVGGTWTEEGDTLRSSLTWTVFNGDIKFLVRADSVWIAEAGQEPYLSDESSRHSQAMFRFYAKSNRCGVSSELIYEESQTLVYRGAVAFVDSTKFPHYELDSMCPVAEVRDDGLFYVSHDETYDLDGFYNYRGRYYYPPANSARISAGVPKMLKSMEIRTQGAYCETCCWDIGPGEDGCGTERRSGTSSVSSAPSTSNPSGTSNPSDTSNPSGTSNPPEPVLTGVRFEFFGSAEGRDGFVLLAPEPADARLSGSFNTNPPGASIYFDMELDTGLLFRFSCPDTYTGPLTITTTARGRNGSEHEASLVFTCQ